jgi:hypothetical protein
MRRLGIIVMAAAVLGIAGAAVIGKADKKVPELKMEELQEAFNAAHKQTRLLVTFSPT